MGCGVSRDQHDVELGQSSAQIKARVKSAPAGVNPPDLAQWLGILRVQGTKNNVVCLVCYCRRHSLHSDLVLISVK